MRCPIGRMFIFPIIVIINSKSVILALAIDFKITLFCDVLLCVMVYSSFKLSKNILCDNMCDLFCVKSVLYYRYEQKVFDI